MIDTIKVSETLQASGLPEKQADAIAQAMLEVPRLTELATKTDLAELKTSLLFWFVGAFALNAIAQLIAAFHK